MCRYRIISSPNQPVPRFDSSRNHSKSNGHRNLSLLQTAMAACLSVVMICSIIGAGFSSEGGSFPAGQNPSQNYGSGGGRSRHHSPQLTVSASSLSFGNVPVNTATTLSLTLTSTGTLPVTVYSASITGAGFSIVAQSFPVTLNPTQSLTLLVQFDPTMAGNASGQLTINSNSSTGSTTVVSLQGSSAAANPVLTISATSLSFGSVTENTASTKPLTLTSSGTSPVTVNSASISGAGFSIVGGSFPVTLTPTQTLTLQVQFDPTSIGNASGQLTINSNSSSSSTAVVTLSGVGTSIAHQVGLSWDAPVSSPDFVAGYHIYRSPINGSFALLNTLADTAVTYVDSTVVSGSSYSYEVRSVDSSGEESIPSNQVTITVP